MKAESCFLFVLMFHEECLHLILCRRVHVLVAHGDPAEPDVHREHGAVPGAAAHLRTRGERRVGVGLRAARLPRQQPRRGGDQHHEVAADDAQHYRRLGQHTGAHCESHALFSFISFLPFSHYFFLSLSLLSFSVSPISFFLLFLVFLSLSLTDLILPSLSLSLSL